MVRFKRHGPSRTEPDRYFGIVFHTHPKYNSIEIFLGGYIYEIWTGYKK